MSNDDDIAEKKDPIKIHREGTALADTGKHKEAIGKFLEAYELYEKAGNLFDASYTLFKAAECSFLTKDFKTALERFLKAADISLEISYDRFGISALEYALDCYNALKKKKKAAELEKKIKELKDKLLTM
jgi:tetratricopeptide (TPR) repeat protein